MTVASAVADLPSGKPANVCTGENRQSFLPALAHARMRKKIQTKVTDSASSLPSFLGSDPSVTVASGLTKRGITIKIASWTDPMANHILPALTRSSIR